jgi:hypothetical protein
MSRGAKKRPFLGDFRYLLFTDKGRFTSDFRQAQFFSIVSGDKNTSKRQPFPTDYRKADEKLALAGYAVAKILHERDMAGYEQKKRHEAEKGRPIPERTTRKIGQEKKFLDTLAIENRKLSKAVAQEIKERRERRKIGGAKKRAPSKKLKTVSATTVINHAHEMAGWLITERRSLFPSETYSTQALVDTFVRATISTQGEKTDVQKRTINGKEVFVQVGDNPFEIAEKAGINGENHLWTIARNYLRELGYDFFLNLCRRAGRMSISLGVAMSTSLEKPKNSPRETNFVTHVAQRFGQNIWFSANPDLKSGMMDKMTYQLVLNMVRALNAAQSMETKQSDYSTPSEYSVTSSGKYSVTLLPKQPWGGAKSTKKKEIKIVFTLFSPEVGLFD